MSREVITRPLTQGERLTELVRERAAARQRAAQALRAWQDSPAGLRADRRRDALLALTRVREIEHSIRDARTSWSEVPCDAA